MHNPDACTDATSGHLLGLPIATGFKCNIHFLHFSRGKEVVALITIFLS